MTVIKPGFHVTIGDTRNQSVSLKSHQWAEITGPRTAVVSLQNLPVHFAVVNPTLLLGKRQGEGLSAQLQRLSKLWDASNLRNSVRSAPGQ